MFNRIVPLGPAVAVLSAILCAATPAAFAAAQKPNILLCIADDWSWPHAGAFGDKVVRTPAIDRLAASGVVFHRAFCAAPSCTPSRAAMLTGRYPHALEQGGNLWSFLPAQYTAFPDLLEKAGYKIGHARKGWGPGDFKAGGRDRNPAGPNFRSLESFLGTLPAATPFFFWFGSQDPHRPYEKGAGKRAGLNPEKVQVPRCWPDTPEIREDILDYYFEVERFDREVGEQIELLESKGLLDNTVVIITSDNGMPFPRAKANLYDLGTHLPLVVWQPKKFRPRAIADAFVSLADLAPTLLEVAGLEPPPEMQARGFLPLLRGEKQGGRSHVFFERERHANVRKGDLSYPARAVRTAEFLYIRNLHPERWPAGDPEMHQAVGPFGDVDNSPSKSLVLKGKDDPKLKAFFDLAFAKRPAEELYHLASDPAQTNNLARVPAFARAKDQLSKLVDDWMRATADPRIDPANDAWSNYPYFGNAAPMPESEKRRGSP